MTSLLPGSLTLPLYSLCEALSNSSRWRFISLYLKWRRRCNLKKKRCVDWWLFFSSASGVKVLDWNDHSQGLLSKSTICDWSCFSICCVIYLNTNPDVVTLIRFITGRIYSSVILYQSLSTFMYTHCYLQVHSIIAVLQLCNSKSKMFLKTSCTCVKLRAWLYSWQQQLLSHFICFLFCRSSCSLLQMMLSSHRADKTLPSRLPNNTTHRVVAYTAGLPQQFKLVHL